MGPSDWRRFLADPTKQWKERKSAYEAAVAWEAARKSARGLPRDIEAVLDAHPEFMGASLLFGVPEHQVRLAGGGHASQTDFWALLLTPLGIVSTAVEAKAGEPFDVTVAEWLATATKGSGKAVRLKQLCELWGVAEDRVSGCRYQLMHRPATAVLEAQRFGLKTALFIVHAFGDNSSSLADYVSWRVALGFNNSSNALQHAGSFGGVSLWIAWVASDPADHATVRAAV